jgi:hypothetical protein
MHLGGERAVDAEGARHADPHEVAQGNTTVSGPKFLMERFGAAPKAAEGSGAAQRRQSVEATGEIRESAGPARLALLIGSKCPQAKPPRGM